MPRKTATNVESTENVSNVVSTPAPAKFVPSFTVTEDDDFTVTRSGGRGRQRDTTWDAAVDAMHETGKIITVPFESEKDLNNALIKMRNYSQDRYGLTVNVRKSMTNDDSLVVQMKLGEKAKRNRKPKD